MTRSSALLTDRYELTMLSAALRDGTAHRACVFDVFARRLPGGRRFGVFAGTGRLLALIKSFTFGEDELRFLRDNRIVDADTLTFLQNYRFRGTLTGYREGDLYFPNSPVLTVEGTFAEAVIIETLALSVLNHDSAVATAASRMSIAAGERPLSEMGSRRAAEESAVAGARAAYIAGFAATSNLEAGRRYGIPTMGTAAHAWTLLHDTETDAFRSQVDALGVQTTLLVDTYDIKSGVQCAIDVAGPTLGGVRIDSGDLPVVATQVRAQLDTLGAHNTKITVTSDLDEFAIAALAASPVDSYGVGTSVATGSGYPTAGMVFKLVARQNSDGSWEPVAKASANKATTGGRKHAYRHFQNGTAVREVICVDVSHGEGSRAVLPAASSGESYEPLHVPLISHGHIHEEFVGPAGVTAARIHHENARAQLPQAAHALSRSDPALDVVFIESTADLT